MKTLYIFNNNNEVLFSQKGLEVDTSKIKTLSIDVPEGYYVKGLDDKGKPIIEKIPQDTVSKLTKEIDTIKSALLELSDTIMGGL